MYAPRYTSPSLAAWAPAADAARLTPLGARSTAEGPRRLVFEIGTEEMPPAEAQAAREQLSRLVIDALAGTRLPHGGLTVLATPRRLVAIVEQVAGRESDHIRLVRRPRLSAAFGPDGALRPAASGFARAHGVTVGDLERAEVNGVEHLVLRRHESGRNVLEALSGALAGVVSGLRAAKNMRWCDPRLSFTRPIRWLLALWGQDVVPVRVSTLAAGRATRVLRSAAQPVITVSAAEDYLDHLYAAGILLDPAQRRDQIIAAATELAATVGGCIDTGGESALIETLTYLSSTARSARPRRVQTCRMSSPPGSQAMLNTDPDRDRIIAAFQEIALPTLTMADPQHWSYEQV